MKNFTVMFTLITGGMRYKIQFFEDLCDFYILVSNDKAGNQFVYQFDRDTASDFKYYNNVELHHHLVDYINHEIQYGNLY